MFTYREKPINQPVNQLLEYTLWLLLKSCVVNFVILGAKWSGRDGGVGVKSHN